MENKTTKSVRAAKRYYIIANELFRPHVLGGFGVFIKLPRMKGTAFTLREGTKQIIDKKWNAFLVEADETNNALMVDGNSFMNYMEKISNLGLHIVAIFASEPVNHLQKIAQKIQKEEDNRKIQELINPLSAGSNVAWILSKQNPANDKEIIYFSYVLEGVLNYTDDKYSNNMEYFQTESQAAFKAKVLFARGFGEWTLEQVEL